jgi:3-methyl-2-oxobutanoate hydroxymethyltransferase
MSTRPQNKQGDSDRKPVTLPLLREMKEAGRPIVMVTAYDHPSAQVADAAEVDIVLVGDSAAMTVLGYDSTVPVGMDEMLMLASAVRRGLDGPLLVGDMPFGSYERSDDQAVENALRFVKEAGCDAVKLERGGSSVDRAKAIVNAGIPVMGHVGLTPQTATQLGGYKAQGKTAERAAQIADEALALQGAGCFSIVFEAVPAAVTEALMSRMEIPVIGIGAGHDTDGQVLVFHDLLGIFGGHAAKFVKRYANIREEMIAGVAEYAAEVRSGAFPGPEHIYAIEPSELSEFRAYLDQGSREKDAGGTFGHSDWDWGP